MSVLIEMEMPKSCGHCALLTYMGNGKQWYCPSTGKRIENAYRERNTDCPMREVREDER